MNDESIEGSQQHQPEYDTRDPEVPVVLHHPFAGSENVYSHKETRHSKNYVRPTLDWLRSCRKWIWGNIFINDRLWIVVSTIVIAIATSVYTHYARKQLESINNQLPEIQKSASAAKSAAETSGKQFDLMRQQMIYTQEAQVTCRIMLTIRPNGENVTKFRVDLMNDGHEMASDAYGSFRVTARTVLQREKFIGQPIGTTQHFMIMTPYPLSPIQDRDKMLTRGSGRFNSNSYGEDFIVSIPDKTLNLIMNAEALVEIKGTITYYNGFGQTIDPVCFIYLNYTKKGAPSPWMVGLCRDFSHMLDNALQAKREDSKK
jgi:hypothetical protein